VLRTGYSGLEQDILARFCEHGTVSYKEFLKFRSCGKEAKCGLMNYDII
jgi:hypothetical protein